MRVDFRDMDGAVSEHFLYIADVDIRIQKAGCKGVTEHVRRDVQVDSGERSIFVQHPPDCLICKSGTCLICKEMTATVNLMTKAVFIFLKNTKHSAAANI